MKSRSGIQVMAGLIGMIRPLLSKMCLAVLMGCVGNLMATFITVLGAYGLTTLLGLTGGLKLSVIFTLLAVFSVLRGILRYAEQASNHYIAFKLLAEIRHQVFAALRFSVFLVTVQAVCRTACDCKYNDSNNNCSHNTPILSDTNTNFSI